MVYWDTGIHEGLLICILSYSNVPSRVIGKFHALLLNVLVRSKHKWPRSLYWNLRAWDIHKKWGDSTKDYQVLRTVIESVKPTRLLDFGCGSGRCFPLYLEMNIPEVIGQEISPKAIEICRKRFPGLLYTLKCCDVNKCGFEENDFDIIISTRVLSAILPENITRTVEILCRVGETIYLNEITDSDYSGPSNYLFKHDYDKLISKNNFSIDKTGTITVDENGKNYIQTWKLYKKVSPCPKYP
jgi:SAM-dependent methyltransferase